MAFMLFSDTLFYPLFDQGIFQVREAIEVINVLRHLIAPSILMRAALSNRESSNGSRD